MFTGAAHTHKRMFDKLVDEVGEDIVLRYAATKATSTSVPDKVFGPRATIPVAINPLTDTIRAIWSNAYDTASLGAVAIPAAIAAIGKTGNLDAILRLKLTDALLDQALTLGRTRFDSAIDVQFRGATYTIRATDRSGLPPLGPYILWVALAKSGGA